MTTQLPPDPGGPARVSVLVRYWAGARAAAGVATERVEAATPAEALLVVRRRRDDPAFDRVLEVCSMLIDGEVVGRDRMTAPLTGPVELEVLPPFAGGAR